MPKWTEDGLAKLQRWVKLGVITQEEYDGMRTGHIKLPDVPGTEYRVITPHEMLQDMQESNEPILPAQEILAEIRKRDGDWAYFVNQIQEGDEIWVWDTIAGFTGSKGYIIVRNGQAVDYLKTAVS